MQAASSSSPASTLKRKEPSSTKLDGSDKTPPTKQKLNKVAGPGLHDLPRDLVKYILTYLKLDETILMGRLNRLWYERGLDPRNIFNVLPVCCKPFRILTLDKSIYVRNPRDYLQRFYGIELAPDFGAEFFVRNGITREVIDAFADVWGHPYRTGKWASLMKLLFLPGTKRRQDDLFRASPAATADYFQFRGDFAYESLDYMDAMSMIFLHAKNVLKRFERNFEAEVAKNMINSVIHSGEDHLRRIEYAKDPQQAHKNLEYYWSEEGMLLSDPMPSSSIYLNMASIYKLEVVNTLLEKSGTIEIPKERLKKTGYRSLTDLLRDFPHKVDEIACEALERLAEDRIYGERNIENLILFCTRFEDKEYIQNCYDQFKDAMTEWEFFS